MDDSALCRLFKRGFIPGPHETVEAFGERVALFEEIAKEPGAVLERLKIEGSLDTQIGFSTCAAPFSFDWLLVVKGAKGLSPWEAGATWLISDEEGRVIPVVQLRERSSWLSIDEVFRHESVHITRSAFKEPLFEEILAYRKSRSRWRRYLGPLFVKTVQARLFMLYLTLTLILQWIALFFLPSLLLIALFWSLPFGYLTLLFSKLVNRQKIFKKFLEKLASRYGNEKAELVALLFTDGEIVQLSKTRDPEGFFEAFVWGPRSQLFHSLVRSTAEI